MADPAEPFGPNEQAIERYAAIEQAYRDQQWPTVLQEGRRLLNDLGGGNDPISAGLRQRLLLLLGHSHLHGLGDPEAARRFYGAVMTEDTDDSLRRIAEEGLAQCGTAGTSEVGAAPEQASATAPEQVSGAAPEQAAAMPWLEASGVSPLIPEVVEEPELIELHQADPSSAEEVEVEVRSGGAEAIPDREDQDLRKGLLRVMLR